MTGKVAKKLQGFLLHSYPTEHIDQDGNSYWARIPDEELAIVQGIEWPVVNGHSIDRAQELDRTDRIGRVQNTAIAGGYLYANNIEVDLPHEDWEGDELSTVFSATSTQLENSYDWIDSEGKIGAPGKSYPVSVHHRGIAPVNIALVKEGRFGQNVAVRDRNDRFLITNAAIKTSKDKEPSAMAELKDKPTLPDENQAAQKAATEHLQGIVTQMFTDTFAPIQAQMEAFQTKLDAALTSGTSSLEAVVANAKAELDQIVTNAKAGLTVKSDEKSEKDEKPLTQNEIVVNAAIAAAQEVIKSNLKVPSSQSGESGAKSDAQTLSEIFVANRGGK